MVTVAIVHKCTIMHKLVWVFFCSNCVKLTTFFILHNYAQADVIALNSFFHCIFFILLNNNNFLIVWALFGNG